MPRQHAVYGKRSRAVTHKPDDIFASPQNAKQRILEAVVIAEDKEEDVEDVQVTQRASSPPRRRKALGERSGNEVLKVELPLGKKSKKSSRRKAEDDTTRKRDECVHLGSTRHQTRGQEPAGAVVETWNGDAQKASQREDVELCLEVTQSMTVADSAETIERRDSPLQERVDHEVQRPSHYALFQAKDQAVQAPQLTAFDEHCQSILGLTSHSIATFSTWASELNDHFDITKIAEASFGEVYRLSLAQALASDDALPISRTEESVLKIIALTPPEATLPNTKRERERMLKKASGMSKPGDVASEVQLLQRLSSIPGFTNFRDVRIVQGRPPAPFIHAFNAFNTAQKEAKKESSIFPDPAKKSSYSENQLWAVIEMQDAGSDLERLVAQGRCRNIWAAWDIFWQVVLALAKGEEAAEFEHRDLHLGNICVRGAPEADFKLDIDTSRRLGFTPLEATLIDYTISRCSMPNETDPAVAYIDLANDPHLFVGDSTEEYQYDIYRYMRSAVYFSSPLADFPAATSSEDPDPIGRRAIEETGRHWEQFHPMTNLVWLHFVLYMLLEQLEWPSSMKAPSAKAKKTAKGKEEDRLYKRAIELEQVLLHVQDQVDPNVLGSEDSMVWRASDLVGLALEQGWLEEEDVMGAHGLADADTQAKLDASVNRGMDVGEELGLRLEALAIDQGEKARAVVSQQPAAKQDGERKIRTTRTGKHTFFE